MVNGENQPIEIVKRPVSVLESAIIRQTPKVLDSNILIIRPSSCSIITTGGSFGFNGSWSPIAMILCFSGSNPVVSMLIIRPRFPGPVGMKEAVGIGDGAMSGSDSCGVVEGLMLSILFSKIDDGAFNEVIGYGFSFDLRFVVVRAMKLGIPCKQFSDMDIYDLMQAMAQVKFQFVYNAQRPPKLSDVGDFFWGFPKPFTDLEMLKFYAQGQFSKVVEFTSSQITRILLLYNLFRGITENPFDPNTSGNVGEVPISNNPTSVLVGSKLTIPEANAPLTWLAKCPVDLSEHDVPIDQTEFKCPIDGTIIKRP